MMLANSTATRSRARSRWSKVGNGNDAMRLARDGMMRLDEAWQRIYDALTGLGLPKPAAAATGPAFLPSIGGMRG